ncbi:MAG TPA: contractile injection system protein, VgrG/Pvc8 family [Blastocatellia bacterium]|nr:contractile injection system protein, VgrG/Pvc8 family [Blastocatellia bacterium]
MKGVDVPEITATISIEDEAATDLFPSLIELEVEEDHRLAGMFKIKLATTKADDGLWIFLDDERVKPWKKVTISATVADGEVELITGYITLIKPHIDLNESQSVLEIYGTDATCLMSVEEKIKDWPNKSDSDIAQEIFAGYNLTATVDATEVIHDEAVSTIIQRETDAQFLKRLARRNGFECFVKGDTGFFRKPVLTEPAQPVLAIQFGAETNLLAFDARLNALRPAATEMHQIDTIGKQVEDAVVESSDQRLLGRDGTLSLATPNGAAARLFVKHAVATGQPEMEKLCRALFDEAEWFIEASGKIDSAIYGAILQAKKLVPIKGVGESFSGIYYVTKVKHVFTLDGYVQEFTARRNAMAPSGPADFAGGGLLGGLL